MAAIHDFIKERPHLIWYVKNYDRLSERSVVEHTLNYGTWNDVQELVNIMGIKDMAAIFKQYAFEERTNYLPEIKLYFDRYFTKHNAYA